MTFETLADDVVVVLFFFIYIYFYMNVSFRGLLKHSQYCNLVCSENRPGPVSGLFKYIYIYFFFLSIVAWSRSSKGWCQTSLDFSGEVGGMLPKWVLVAWVKFFLGGSVYFSTCAQCLYQKTGLENCSLPTLEEKLLLSHAEVVLFKVFNWPFFPRYTKNIC